MSTPLALLLAALFLALLLAPLVHFLLVGWQIRFQSIRRRFRATACALYFERFHPLITQRREFDAVSEFRKYLYEHYGRRQFFLPGVLLGLLAAVALFWTALTLRSQMLGETAPWMLPELVVYALMGAYMWVLYDLIGRNRSLSLHPSDLYWAAFRIALAAPTAAAIASNLGENWSPPIAFLLGTFPTNSLFDLLNRIARRSLGMEEKQAENSELTDLQSLGPRQVRAFGDQGVTTNLELAYADPIHLTVRTGLDFVYVMDCSSQALLWIYLEDKLGAARKCGIRGAQEMSNFYDQLEPSLEEEPEDDADDDADDDEEFEGQIAEAEALLAVFVAESGFDDTVLRNIAFEVAGDPQTAFLHALWEDAPDPVDEEGATTP